VFQKVLVANRGEIALRIIRTLKEMGLQSVAVFSEPDRDAPHVHLADEAVCIGPGPAKDSYLNEKAIIAAAEITDADAIHPGYGFFAENAHFREICQSAGIHFIGPSLRAIRLMGNKIRARAIMKRRDIPVVEGSERGIKDPRKAFEEASRIGFPVILKAALGGGGKGMKRVEDPLAFTNAFLSAQAEVKAAFGDNELYVERLIEDARHVEVQIVGDHFGNLVHLFERNCSIQNNYQKLLEEAPSPGLSDKTRKALCKTAIRAGEALRYASLGTVEFLVDKQDRFYFMEMNTRIQVEHPVTEMVTGLDLVKEQVRVAMGMPLSVNQHDVSLRGHAIEARINAVDPKKLTPSPGKITGLFVPGGIGVRFDTYLRAGLDVPPYYDSMIGKLIVHGPTREDARIKLLVALEELYIQGICTNKGVCQAILKGEAFVEGSYHTGFFKEFHRLWSAIER
jgi:acetyl-CoA carboxylase biotin carboxylase subunit